MPTIIDSIRAEYLRYKSLAEGAIRQLSDEELSSSAHQSDNSIAVICWHVSGNLRSRFTDFLTTDGEKPWRRREEEFQPRQVTRGELLEKWEQGWSVLFATLSGLTDAQLGDGVTIRGDRLEVQEALHRSLAHVAYHVGQIVYIAKAARADGWSYLSIPPGGSGLTGVRP
jgi:uncharacterized damage-inducible protein DinB